MLLSEVVGRSSRAALDDVIERRSDLENGSASTKTVHDSSGEFGAAIRVCLDGGWGFGIGSASACAVVPGWACLCGVVRAFSGAD